MKSLLIVAGVLLCGLMLPETATAQYVEVEIGPEDFTGHSAGPKAQLLHANASALQDKATRKNEIIAALPSGWYYVREEQTYYNYTGTEATGFTALYSYKFVIANDNGETDPGMAFWIAIGVL